MFQRIKWFCISLVLMSLSEQELKAQVWGSYTFSGFTDGWAWADNQWFPPVGPPCVIQPFPSPTVFTFHETIFSPSVWGHQIGSTPHSIRTTESAHICEPGPQESATVNAASHASYFVDGLETSRVTLSYKIGPNVQGNPEVLYDGYATAELDVTAMLDVTNSPNGFPLQIYWSWKHVGAMGGSNFSELGNEDFCSTSARLFINDVEQFNGTFDFTNSFGRVELINQTGVINTFVGQSTTTVRIHLTGDVEVQNPPYYLSSGVPEMDEFQAYQAGYIRLSLNAPNPLTEPDSLSGYWTDFTVDVGGDAELSDVPYDSNEVFDPADIYVWHSPPLPSGGADGKGYEMDDSTVFGYDPNPNPPDLIPPATGVPVGGVFNPFTYLDIDDYDFLDFYLGDFLYGPGNPPIGFFLSGCVYVPDDIYLSFDDDWDQNWSAAIGIPVQSSSPYQNDIYGQTGRRDEIIRLQITYPGGGGQLATQYPFQSEQELHQSLGPNPTAGNNTLDDDVDGMDIRDGQCNVLYFTVDHEAKLGYDPGTVYRHCDNCGILPVVDPQIHLGIPYGVDLDAIEFAWVEGLTGKEFALLFSVDDDDPNTPEDERGRDPFNNPLDPRMIYFSFLNGTFSTFLAQPLADDIDALAVWKDPLTEEAALLPVNDLVIRAVAGNLQFNFTAPQSGSYHLYGTTNPNLIALPPAAGWTLTASMSALSSGQAMQHSMPIPGPNYQRYTITASRP